MAFDLVLKKKIFPFFTVLLSIIYGGFVSARGSAEALRRLCERFCGGSAKALRRLCGCFVSNAECLFRDALPLDDRPGKLFTRYILLTNTAMFNRMFNRTVDRKFDRTCN